MPRLVSLSALTLLIALPVAAQDYVISPVLTEEAADAQAAQAAQVGQAVESVPADSPFLLIDRVGDDVTSTRDWLLNRGIDRPGDLDPRDSLLIPQPEPNLILRLR